MKKLFLISSALLFFIFSSDAQNKNGYIGLSIGSSTPLGDLSSKDIDNDAAGFADPGALIDLSFAYKFNDKSYGLTAMLRGQINPTDVQAIADEFANEFPNINWTVESDGWGIGGFLFGGFNTVTISEKTSLDFKALFGFLNAVSPEINITGSVPGSSIWAKQSSASAKSFSYL